MLKTIALLIFTLTFLVSCSSEKYEKLTISSTTWIGYSPLFYAKEKGWLEPYNIKLLHVVSLSENMYLYESGNADAYVGTQYEYGVMSQKDKTLLPIMTFDRSYGGDIILSNLSIEALKKADYIEAFLELDSINNTLLTDFIMQAGIDAKKIHFINKDQSSISTLQNQASLKPTIIVTYSPYNIKLEKNGFSEIASTKQGLGLFVVDAMFTQQATLKKHKAQFVALKKMVDEAVLALNKNPKEFYDTIKPYLLELSYEEFNKSLKDIIWINGKLDQALIDRMHKTNLPTQGIL